MAVRKTQVVSYEGVDAGLFGDILYWNGSDWVRLAPNDDGKRLVTHGTTGGPSWEWLIYNGAVIWYTPGGSWHIGPYIGLIWYKTTTYEGTDPAQAALDVWVSTDPEYDPVPSISYNVGTQEFTVTGAGVSQANDIYKQKGENDGVPTYGNPAWIDGTPTSSSSSSSVVPLPGCCQRNLMNPMPFPAGIPGPFCSCYSALPPLPTNQMNYTLNGAGNSTPGVFPTEGWVPVGWNPGLSEIFFDGGGVLGSPAWYLYDPIGVLAPPGPVQFQNFVNGIDGCAGLNFGINPGGPFITVNCCDLCSSSSSSSSSSSWIEPWPPEPSSSSSSSSSSPFEEPMWYCVDVEPQLPGCTGPIGPIEQRCMLGPVIPGQCCFDGINWYLVIGINSGPYPTPDCSGMCTELICIPEPPEPSSSSSSSSSSAGHNY